MNNELLLLSKNDIPFPDGQLTIHQPTMKEIAYIGEDNFFMGCQLLNFSKDLLNDKDKSDLEDKSDFEILMSIIESNEPSLAVQKNQLEMVLLLLFPDYHPIFFNGRISLIQRDIDGNIIEKKELNNDNYKKFLNIITEMFCLDLFMKNIKDNAFNPTGDMASSIAKKLQERHKKLSKMKGGDGEKISIFSRYISILSVGEYKDMNTFFSYTVFQLVDEFQRFQLKNNFDFYVKAKLAGASEMKEVDDWMKEIHSKSIKYDF